MWSTVDEDTWPPIQPKRFLPLLLIHHLVEYTLKQSNTLASVLHVGGVDNITSKGKIPEYSPLTKQQSVTELFAACKVTKQISEIFSPLENSTNPQFILIEGLPGIGKPLLLQEIVCKWSDKKLLAKFKLILLIRLRDPVLREIATISQLLHHLCCEGDEGAKGIVSACNDYFCKNGGEDLLFLFDGYDEFPDSLRKDSLIANILKRSILPLCGMVVSSRPHESVHLRKQATIIVNILGFAEKEREKCIKDSLEGHPEKVTELTEYLESHHTINGLCFIPFNMIALLHLCKVGHAFPSNSVELYNHFIFSSIRQNLSRAGCPLDDTIEELSQLPKKYCAIINQLSELSFNALNDNKLIFTLDEMNSACPSIASIPEAVNGFGLLQVVQHFSPTAKTKTFNFVHFSIQEYLAAYHIASLPPQKQKVVLDEKFWSDTHANMFSIYTTLTLTKRQSKPLKEFLQRVNFMKAFKNVFAGGSNDSFIIDKKFLKDQLKCLRLFRYFLEAGDDFKAICDSIQAEKIFKDQVINLGGIPLTTYDVECVSLFLTTSPCKEWKMVSLYGCLIRDHGLSMLKRRLVKSDLTIKQLWLQCNGLTQSSASSISDLAIHCKVEELVINGNHTIGENCALYNMLSHSSLNKLHLRDISLSTNFTKVLFTKLLENNTLQCLEISNNPITDDASNTIATAMKENTSLVELWMWGTKISATAAEQFVDVLVNNDNLERLYLPLYSEDKQIEFQLVQSDINNARSQRACLKIFSIAFN